MSNGCCVIEGDARVTAGEKGRAGTPLPAAARTECAPYHPSLTDYE